MNFLPGWGGMSVGPIITLSGEPVSSLDTTLATAELKIDDDGRAYKRLNEGSYSQLDTATDWIRPVTFAPGRYKVRFTSFSGDALASSTVTENTWHSLSTSDFAMILQQSGLGSKTCSFTLQISLDETNILASGSYSLSVTVTV